ncbi:pyrroline-5-carboxylate reductase [Bacillus massilinigeriensis]|uniref:pyrroline-5-carboxylate reductase n=1 Tax=Bacillus massilionigeriensis TaxID=1805475 RepID=UPI00096B34C7|nr:pyrroline-5-carboxylate reductase [Bacillus massilionigeriensis]
MRKNIGFIGCGKMAQAMIEGIIKSNNWKSSEIIASAKSQSTLDAVKKRLNITTSLNNKDVANWADILILAIKPNLHEEVIHEINESIKPDTIVVTIAAGITIEYLERHFYQKLKIMRAMPNTPSLVGEGMSAICGNQLVTEEDLLDVRSLFHCFGKVEVVEEHLMDAIPAVSGSSPAFVYMFIEALADGAVKEGITRDKAYVFAAQAVLGAAKMVLETGKHPGELKDEVCTPGGSTIEAVASLEQSGFRSAVITAMESCTKKTKKLLSNN